MARGGMAPARDVMERCGPVSTAEQATAGSDARPLREGLFVLAAPDGKPALLASVCPRCGRHFYPTRAVCLGCGHVGLDRAHLSRDGEVWSYTVVRQTPPGALVVAPYALAEIALPEGVRVRSLVTECEPEDVRVGMPVSLHTFPISKDDDGNDLIAFAFRPAGGVER